MHETTIRRIVIYVRVSSKMQVDGFSLSNQREELEEYAKRHGYEIVEIYEDAGISGKNTKDRPDFKKMMKDIKRLSRTKDKIDAVLVWKLSRFSRSIADLASNISILKKQNCFLISYRDNVNTIGKMNEAILYVLGVFAEMERENIVDNAKTGMHKGASEGYIMGGLANYGYTHARTSDNKPTLAIREDEATYVRLIFEMYADGHGYAKICAYLNNVVNIRTRKGNLFNYTLIQGMLDNPIYNGKVRFGRYEDWNNTERTTDEILEDGTVIKGEKKRKKSDNMIIVDGKHDGIISDDLWNRVRVQRELRTFQPTRKRDYRHLLSGKIKCPFCGTPDVSNIATRKRKDGSKAHTSYYMCGQYNNTKHKGCKPNLIKKDIVDDMFIEYLSKLVNSPVLHEMVASKLNKKVDVDAQLEIIERTQDELKESQKKRKKWVLTFEDNDVDESGMSDSEIKKKIVKYNKQIQEKEMTIRVNEHKIAMMQKEKQLTKDISLLLSNFRVIFESNKLELQKELVRYLVQDIEVTKSTDIKERSIIKSITLQFNGEVLAYDDLSASPSLKGKNLWFNTDTVLPD